MRLPLGKRIYYGIGKRLPFLKIRPPEVDRDAVALLRPVRNSLIQWETTETGEVMLTVPQNQRAARLTRVVAKWMRVPTERQVELDEVGAYVWGQCSGDNTVETIVRLTGKQFKMNRREAEVSVTMFLQMLHERNFIGFYKKVKTESVKGKP